LDSNPPSPTAVEAFALIGRSDPPDPQFNAYRADLADVSLAGRVIASHYAEPLQRSVHRAAELRARPSEDANATAELEPGTIFSLLDDALGWAWGYAGAERRVGYVRSEAFAPA
jgi:Bacterial dipeptidyl-peptidase Sh3 domain